MGTRSKQILIVIVGVAIVGGIFANAAYKKSHDAQNNIAFPSSIDSSASGAKTSTTLSLSQRTYKAGDCVTWQQTDNVSSSVATRVVPCNTSHLFEFAATTQVSGTGATYPTEDEWTSISEAQCRPLAESFLGYKIDDTGRFVTESIRPTAEIWQHGDRTVDCGVDLRAQTAVYDANLSIPFDYEAKGADQNPPVATGTCYQTAAAGRPAGVVDCSAPHQVTYTGSVNIADKTKTLPATDAAWQSLVGSQCSSFARKFLGQALPAGQSAGWFPIQPQSWDTGNRTVMCTVGTL